MEHPRSRPSRSFVIRVGSFASIYWRETRVRKTKNSPEVKIDEQPLLFFPLSNFCALVPQDGATGGGN